jgi:DNA/RNA-binding domain of Phe-tRNA-synthetase-like protein
MIFKIFEEVYKSFPQLKVGIIIARGIDNTKKDKKVASLFNQAIDYIKLTAVPEKATDTKLIPKHLSKSPLISAARAEYEEFGTKEHYRSNVEAITNKIFEGKAPKSTNTLKDMCDYISLKLIVPMGVYDLDKIRGDIFLGLSEGGDKVVSSDSVELTNKKEAIFHDANGLLCRSWHWKTAKRLAVTSSTTNAIIFFVALPPIMKANLKNVLTEAGDLIKAACKGKISSELVSKKKKTIEIK